jgi:hypothetical protein
MGVGMYERGTVGVIVIIRCA